MPSVTTQELVARAQAASDMRDDFVTPTQWMYWASQENLSLNLFLARSGWTLPTADFDLVITGNEGGVYPINPTSNVMAVVCVHEMISNGFRRVRFQDAISFMRQPPGATGGAKGHARFCRFQWSGDTITMNLYPEGNVGETYRVTYLPHPNRLTLDASPASGFANTVAYPMGWEERVVLGMARRALMKEESDTRAVDQETQTWDRRIEEACWNRMLGESPVVRNVDNETYGWSDRIIWPPYPNSWFWA